MKKSHIAILAVAFGLVVFGAYNAYQSNQRLIQAAYDYGQHIGQIQGSCQVIVAASDSDANAALNQSDELKAAISRCRDFLIQHAPGTPDTITLP